MRPHDNGAGKINVTKQPRSNVRLASAKPGRSGVYAAKLIKLRAGCGASARKSILLTGFSGEPFGVRDVQFDQPKVRIARAAARQIVVTF